MHSPYHAAAAAELLQSCLTLCDPRDSSHQAPPSLGFSRQEYWSGLPFPSPMQESEKWKWSCSVMSNSWRPHGLQPTRLCRPWDFPGNSTWVGCHCLLRHHIILGTNSRNSHYLRKLSNTESQYWNNIAFCFKENWKSEVYLHSSGVGVGVCVFVPRFSTWAEQNPEWSWRFLAKNKEARSGKTEIQVKQWISRVISVVPFWVCDFTMNKETSILHIGGGLKCHLRYPRPKCIITKSYSQEIKYWGRTFCD